MLQVDSCYINKTSYTGQSATVASISTHIQDNLSGNNVTTKALSANQGYQLSSQITAVKNSLSGYSTTSHNHDSVYSKLGHTHDYASSSHNHDSVYSKLNHTHSYAATNHDHDSVYSKLGHTHDEYLKSGDYLPLSGGTLTGALTVPAAKKFVAGTYTIGGDGTYNNQIKSNTGAHICANSNSSDVWLHGGSVKVVDMDSGNNNWKTIYAAGFSNQSSRRYKENFSDISDREAKKLLDIKTYHFDYINGEKNQSGCIAEEVEEIYPEICDYDHELGDEGGPEVLVGLSYSKFIPYIIKLLQIHSNDIEKLKIDM